MSRNIGTGLFIFLFLACAASASSVMGFERCWQYAGTGFTSAVHIAVRKKRFSFIIFEKAHVFFFLSVLSSSQDGIDQTPRSPFELDLPQFKSDKDLQIALELKAVIDEYIKQTLSSDSKLCVLDGNTIIHMLCAQDFNPLNMTAGVPLKRPLSDDFLRYLKSLEAIGLRPIIVFDPRHAPEYKRYTTAERKAVSDKNFKQGVEAFESGDMSAANDRFKGCKVYTYTVIQRIILDLRKAGYTVLESLDGHEGDINVMAVANALNYQGVVIISNDSDYALSEFRVLDINSKTLYAREIPNDLSFLFAQDGPFPGKKLHQLRVVTSVFGNDGNGHAGKDAVRIPLMRWDTALRNNSFPPNVTVEQVNSDPHTNNFTENVLLSGLC
jgi:hypothetical protein